MRDGWRTTTIDDACHIEYGTRVVQKRDGGSTYPVYGGGGATFFMDTSNRANRVVVARFGMSELCTRYVDGDFFLNDSGLTLSPRDTNVLLPEFLDRVALALNDQIFALGKGAAQKNLDIPAFRGLKFAYPESPSEQRRIVAILDEAFEAIAIAKANTEKNLQNTRDVLDGFVAQQLLDGDQSWSAKKLRDLCVVDWGNTKLTKSAYVEGGEFLAVSAAGCDGRIGHREHKAYTPVLSAIGAQCGRMFLPTEDFTAIKNTMTLTPRQDACSGPFLYRLLTAVKLPKRGAAQPFMAKGDIEEFVVRIPSSLEKQNLIVDAVDALEFDTDRLAALLERKLAALDELKKSLLQQAFTGQLTGKATDRQLEALA